MELFDRKEYKYYVDYRHLESLRRRFLTNMEYDPFCRDLESKCYTVRSIYLDTRNLLFYYEKKNGIKIRKKLRIRTYNEGSHDSTAFLEIKRKNQQRVFKERSKIWLAEAPNLLNGARLELVEDQPEYREKLALDRFIYLTKRLKLEPQSLIAYEREAFVGLDDPTLRVTFDLNVRSYLQPDPTEIFREDDLKHMESSRFILEIKFTGRMPFWVRCIIRDFKLRIQSISKYCNGLDAWRIKEAALGTSV